MLYHLLKTRPVFFVNKSFQKYFFFYLCCSISNKITSLNLIFLLSYLKRTLKIIAIFDIIDSLHSPLENIIKNFEEAGKDRDVVIEEENEWI